MKSPFTYPSAGFGRLSYAVFGGLAFIVFVPMVMVALMVNFSYENEPAPSETTDNSDPVSSTPTQSPMAEKEEYYAGSASCKGCHAAQFGEWEASQHAGAARPFESGQDRGDFEPSHEVSYGSVESAIRLAWPGIRETVGSVTSLCPQIHTLRGRCRCQKSRSTPVKLA